LYPCWPSVSPLQFSESLVLKWSKYVQYQWCCMQCDKSSESLTDILLKISSHDIGTMPSPWRVAWLVQVG
jgi:hypothetical protein